ncbi:hypothetical protein CASFOL_020509 [Castilleja foliolosa]|uniref:Conserved oligomeric Golgi complex subunit 8 n=1 Tax=Castilleja foliolosa TaxID=1961234 RepID=A0ABD3D2J6_9LAMI
MESRGSRRRDGAAGGDATCSSRDREVRPPRRRCKARVIEGVGASSILELKAQLYKSQEESKRNPKEPINSADHNFAQPLEGLRRRYPRRQGSRVSANNTISLANPIQWPTATYRAESSRDMLFRLLHLVVEEGDNVLAVHVQQSDDDTFNPNTFHIYEDLCKSKQVDFEIKICTGNWYVTELSHQVRLSFATILAVGCSSKWYCAMGLGWVGLDFRGLLPPLFEEAVLNLFSKNTSTAVENFQLVLDSHRWVPLSPVGFPANSLSDESQDDVSVSAAMNELRPCAPLSLKNVLAQELVRGLQAVSDSLLRYNTTRMLKSNETTLFLKLCQVFIEGVFPYCATCFGRCYPGGAALITDAKTNLFDGIGRLLAF